MIKATLAFLTGIVLIQQCQVLPAIDWVLAGIPVVIFLFWREKYGSGFFIFGLLWSITYSNGYLQDRLPINLESVEITVEGEIISLPQHLKRGVRFEFRVDRVITPSGNPRLPQKIRLSWYEVVHLNSGERWRLTVRLKRPHSTFNPGEMDYEQWLFVRHIGATGYVRTQAENSLLQPASKTSIQFWRQQLDRQLSSALAHSRMMGVIKALVIGVRTEISQPQWEVFQRTGTTHLVAISGLHIGLVAGMSFFMTRWLWARLGCLQIAPHLCAAWVALLMAILYAALAGFSIPTQRAMIMIAVMMGSIIFRRKVLSFRLLFLALFLIVLCQPLAVLSPGFWLSFSAVALILYVSVGRLKETSSWLALQRIHWIIALGLSPLLLLFFQQVSIIAPVANILAVPLISLIIVPGSLLGTGLLLIWPSLGTLILHGLAWTLGGLWEVLSYLSDWPLAQWEQPQPPLWTLLFSVPGILLLLAPKGLPARWLGGILFLPALFQQPQKPSYGEMQLTLLDVGQGLAAVVQTAEHTLVFDTGARYSERFNMGAAVISPFLHSKGITTIDTLIVSHGDNDHKGGARSLSRQLIVKQTLSSVPQQLPWLKAELCKDGLSWDWEGVTFRILAADSSRLSSANDLSCVLQVTSKAGSLLLTGDIERGAERALIDQYGSALASDVLIVPHHGSRTSSSLAFIQQVNPRYALIPAGYKNRYRHPSTTVMQRYQTLAIKTFNTADRGAIEVNFQINKGLSIPKSYRHLKGHYWNASVIKKPGLLRQ